METKLGGTLSGAICRTPQQISNEGKPVANASPLTRMQNFEETPQITTKVAHKNTTMEVLKGGKGCKECSEKEEREMEEFGAFRRFKAMRKREVERSSRM